MRRLVRIVSMPFLEMVASLTETKDAYPTPLEAILRAEEALYTHVLALGTLQCARIVPTVEAGAFARLLRSLIHPDLVISCREGWSVRDCADLTVSARAMEVSEVVGSRVSMRD